MVNPIQEALGTYLHVSSRVYFAIRRDRMKVIGAQSHDCRHIFCLERFHIASVPLLNSLTHGLGFVPHYSLTVFNFYLMFAL